MIIRGKGSILRRCISALPTLFMMAVIFYFSSKTGSQSSVQSHAVSESFLKWSAFFGALGVSEKDIPALIETIDFFVRKLGHITEFALLTIAAYIPHALYCKDKIKRYIIAFAVCFLYAALDEIHQIFVADRGPSFTDVLIDCVGGLIGLGIVWIISAIVGNIRRRRKNRVKKTENDI